MVAENETTIIDDSNRVPNNMNENAAAICCFFPPRNPPCLYCDNEFKIYELNEREEREEFVKPLRKTRATTFERGDVSSAEGALPQPLPALSQTSDNEAVNEASKVALIANVILWVLAIVVCVLAHFPVILIASVIDQTMDVMVSILFVYTTHLITAARQSPRSKVNYPIGRKMLEPVLVIAFTAIASTLSLVLIIESIQQLFEKPSKYNSIHLSVLIIIFFVLAVLINLIAFVYCYMIAVKTMSQAAKTLAIDFRNDSMTFLLAVSISFIFFCHSFCLFPLFLFDYSQ